MTADDVLLWMINHPEEAHRQLLENAPELLRQLDELLGETEIRRRLELQPHQIPPEHPWRVWLLLAGRGAGKTQACAHYMNEHALGQACSNAVPGGHRMAIIAPTQGDAVDACIDGPSGLRALCPDIKIKGGVQGMTAIWPNGAVARLFGVSTPNDVDRLRAGGNRCMLWFEELAAWRYLREGLDHARFGLRLGSAPHAIGSTTPKNRREIRELLDEAMDPSTGVRISRGTTYDNKFLALDVLNRFRERYEGTRIGRQELLAEFLDDTEGALWTQAMLDRTRLASFDHLRPWQSLNGWLVSGGERAITDRRAWRTIVAVDPPGETAECGIVVAMAPVQGQAGVDHCVIVEDASMAGRPEEWGAQVVSAARRWNAERVYVETNQGGDMTRATIQAVDPSIRVEKIRAVVGKAARAEPVSALFERGWVHLSGFFPRLEEQLTSWVPGESKSPDRLDAMVHAVATLLTERPTARASVRSVASRRLP